MRFTISTLLMLVALAAVTAHSVRLHRTYVDLINHSSHSNPLRQFQDLDELELLLPIYQSAIEHQPTVEVERLARHRFNKIMKERNTSNSDQ